MEEIKNEKISISTSSYSAELCSVKNVRTGEELMWQADPKYWGRHCPMLFPTVGAVWEGRYLHRGVWRTMPKHGFMQQREFLNVGEAATYALGSGIGWWLAIVALAAIREKMAYSKVPAPLKGLGITFMVVGLMGMAFMTFMGISL